VKPLERQIVAALDRLHRELESSEACRWAYDGGKDVYSCPHLSFTGGQVIGLVQQMNYYPMEVKA